MNPVRFGIVAVLILTLAITITAYPALPDTIPSHWNMAGEVDAYLPTIWGVLIIPLLMVPLSVFFFLLPRIDPLKENYRKFQPYYEGFILVFLVFFLLIQVQIILWGLDYQISPTLIIPPLAGVLFIYRGFLVEHAEQNWFVGIRTPWTLSSEQVWKKTHALGGKLFKVAGSIALAGVFFWDYAFSFVLVPILAVTIYTVAYSYFEYQKEMKGTAAGGTTNSRS
jgi:uncharacterized membrane protein